MNNEEFYNEMLKFLAFNGRGLTTEQISSIPNGTQLANELMHEGRLMKIKTDDNEYTIVVNDEKYFRCEIDLVELFNDKTMSNYEHVIHYITAKDDDEVVPIFEYSVNQAIQKFPAIKELVEKKRDKLDELRKLRDELFGQKVQENEPIEDVHQRHVM